MEPILASRALRQYQTSQSGQPQTGVLHLGILSTVAINSPSFLAGNVTGAAALSRIR